MGPESARARGQTGSVRRQERAAGDQYRHALCLNRAHSEPFPQASPGPLVQPRRPVRSHLAPRKSFLLRLPPELVDELNRWARDELRSLNAQLEYVLRDAVRKQRRRPRRDADE